MHNPAIDMGRKRLLIFDCDGVLFDSHRANIAFFNHCLERGGLPALGKDREEKVAYMSTRQLMFDLIPDPSEARRLFLLSQKTDYTPFIPGLRPLFDFDRVLGRLLSSRHLAVATNRGGSMERLAAHFGLDRWFGLFVSTLDAEPKPHPGMLQKCVAHFGVSEGDALYFGDADSDREAAVRAGIDCILVGASRGIPTVADILHPGLTPDY